VVVCRRAAWVEWAAWAVWTTKSNSYKLTQTINHGRVSQEARLFCLKIRARASLAKSVVLCECGNTMTISDYILALISIAVGLAMT
jgi:hypothetical protein